MKKANEKRFYIIRQNENNKQRCFNEKAIVTGRNSETGPIKTRLPMTANVSMAGFDRPSEGLSVRQSLTDVAHPIAPGTKYITSKNYTHG